MTFGGTNWLREKLYGDTATQNHQGVFYQGGEVAGNAASSALPTNGFKGAQWAQQAVGGYNKVRNIYDRFQDVSDQVGSINNILKGCGGLEDLQNLAGDRGNPLHPRNFRSSRNLGIGNITPESRQPVGLRTWEEAGISPGNARRIQNAANRTKQEITVVGSQAAGTATRISDWDYLMNGSSRQKHSAKSSVPRGTQGGAENSMGNETGIDIWTQTKPDPNLPHVIFRPQ